jgi:hypothetical protein
LSHFELPLELLIAPSEIAAKGRMHAVLDSFIGHIEARRAEVALKLPEVQAMSMRNLIPIDFEAWRAFL